jgi:hypothetical protein
LSGIIKDAMEKQLAAKRKTISATAQRYNFFIRFAVQYSQAGTNF